MRILLVDDDPIVLRALIRAIVARWPGDCSVSTITKADGVLQARALWLAAELDHRPFDVVVTDLDMPDGTGFDLAASLPVKPNQPRIMFMSAIVTAARENRARLLGGKLYDKMAMAEIAAAV